MEKTCSGCLKTKDITEFHLKTLSKDGYQCKCKECRNLHKKEYEKRTGYTKNYCEKNKEIIYQKQKIKRDLIRASKPYISPEERKRIKLEKQLIRERNKRKTNINYRLSVCLRSRIGTALRRRKIKKIGSSVKDMGCSVDFLKEYIESKFKIGMSWENYGEWHIDHIIPLSKFNLQKKEDFLKACHFTNLQPLWATTEIARKYGDFVSIGNLNKGFKIFLSN